jgi:hypothetical protein
MPSAVQAIRRCLILSCAALACAAAAFAQAPPAPAPFVGWTPLGAYEQAALLEQSALRIAVPTPTRVVEVGFTPRAVAASDYGSELVDARGLRRGTRAPRVTTYSGRVDGDNARDFAKLAYSAEDGALEALLRIDGRFYALAANLAAGDWLIDVREVDEAHIAALMRACGVTSESALSAPLTASGGSTASAATALREIELATEADALMVQQHGSVAAANARILSFVNMINGIYETDLGLTNRVVHQRAHTGADPYATTDAVGLLNAFGTNFRANVAVRYDNALLFSGRNLDGSTVGIAWVSATCSSSPFGVVQVLGMSDFEAMLITAHELGHNLGADHTTDGIMTPALSGASYFNAVSQGEIGQYTSRVSCLALAAGSGTNSAPELDPIGPQLVSEGQTLALTLSARDADGDTLQFSASPLPAGASLSAAGDFRWTPGQSTAGCGSTTTTTIQFAVSDGTVTATESVPISVADAQTSSPPAIEDPLDRSIYVGRPVAIALRASDADGDTVSFASPSLPAGATLSASGAFFWTPTPAQTGRTSLDFEARDCTGLTSRTSVDIDVSMQPVPHLTALSKVTGWYGEQVTISGTALAGNDLVVIFKNKRAAIVSATDSAVTVIVPKVKKKYRKRGALPVTFTRDGVRADNVLAFDYVKP